jgi:phosphoserine phosphatase
MCINGANSDLTCTGVSPRVKQGLTRKTSGNNFLVVGNPLTNKLDSMSVLRMNISGPNSEGIAHKFFEALAEYKAMVLDIGQAVIHNHLEMGVLFHIPGGENSAGLLMKDLLFKAFEHGLQVTFTPVTSRDYEAWTEEHGKPRHIFTVVGRKITAEQLGLVARCATEAGLDIDRITRLSGRPILHDDEDCKIGKACVQISVRGRCDETELKSKLFAISHETGIDVAFHSDSIFHRSHRLVCFDMDSTLIQMEVIDELAKRAGVGQKVAEITARAMHGEIDWNQSYKERLGLLKGLSETVLEDIAQNMPLTEGLEFLIRTLKKLGHKLAIISGGFEYFANHLKDTLGFDYVYANKLEIIDGKVTGRVTGDVVNAKRKAEALREIAEREGISLSQTIAVGDGANDLLMLGAAGLGVAFHAKPIVREKAKHAISSVGLDGLLYLLGISDRDVENDFDSEKI